MVRGLPPLKKGTNKCQHCLVGKQHRAPFKHSTFWAKEKLDLVHTNLCGPMRPSHSTFQYFMLFVDDFSRKMWIYCIRTKDEAFENFKKFKAVVEIESGRKIKTLRSDQGGEYTNNEFNDFLETHGICCQMALPHTP